MMRSFRDRDYLITPEGFIFAVIGNLHPADRVIGYLKYVPDEFGKWGRGRQRFRRALQHYNVPSVLDSMRFLASKAPQYLFESSVDNVTLPAVPTDAIVEHLRPEERLLQLETAQHHDGLEDKALRLVRMISEEAKVRAKSMGVTGSILAGIHDPAFSDIDLVVYGFDNALRVRSFLCEPSGAVGRLAGASLEKWITERVNSTPLTRQNAIDLLARKWNIGLFDDTEFSVHAVHTEVEISKRYGDERYVPLGIVDATAKVIDTKESMFMPAVYGVESVDLKGKFPACTVGRIVSFEGLYADIAKEGDQVSCRGKLERVESHSGIEHRILVGSPEARGTDFILPSHARG